MARTDVAWVLGINNDKMPDCHSSGGGGTASVAAEIENFEARLKRLTRRARSTGPAEGLRAAGLFLFFSDALLRSTPDLGLQGSQQ